MLVGVQDPISRDRWPDPPEEEVNMYMKTYQLGDRFYDDRKDRYLEIDSIDIGTRTAMCIVEEYDEDIEDYVMKSRGVFHLSDLILFEEV